MSLMLEKTEVSVHFPDYRRRSIPQLRHRVRHFRHDAGPAIYGAFLGLDAAFTISPFETELSALARVDAWTGSLIHLLLGQNGREGRRQIEYSDTFIRFLRSTTTHLVDGVHHFAEY